MTTPDLDLDALEALREAGTKGPWLADFVTEIDEDGACDLGHVLAPEVDTGDDSVAGVAVSIQRPDAELIVAAVNALPRLVAEVRMLRAEVELAEEGEHPHLYTYDQHRDDHHGNHTCPEDDWKACVRDAGLARIRELEAEVRRLKRNPEMPLTHFFMDREGATWQRVRRDETPDA